MIYLLPFRCMGVHMLQVYDLSARHRTYGVKLSTTGRYPYRVCTARLPSWMGDGLEPDQYKGIISFNTLVPIADPKISLRLVLPTDPIFNHWPKQRLNWSWFEQFGN